jgi:hypothetical protein
MEVDGNGHSKVPPIAFGGGDGTSFEDAIVILGATKRTGVNAEYAYLRSHFPGFQLRSQRMQPREGRNYDIIEFSTPEGTDHELYFDITNFLPFEDAEF